MIPFKNRFHGHNSLNFVYKNGKVVRTKLLTVKYSPNKQREESRLAVVVSKKVLKSAVRRNRIRRRLYEIIQKRVGDLNGVYDIVFIVTSAEVLGIEHAELESLVDQILEQAKIKKS